MTFVIGLTGGIGSGKTTVSDYFAEHGIEVVDADVIARQVVEPGTPAIEAIVEKFGESMLTEDGRLNRQALRNIVFKNNEHKNWLNGLLHPAIRELMKQQIASVQSAYAILSVPLLVENNLTDMVDRVLVVDVDPLLQIERTTKRDNASKEQIEAIMAVQADRQQRLKVADDVIDNSGNAEQLKQQVTSLHQSYLKLAKNLK